MDDKVADKIAADNADQVEKAKEAAPEDKVVHDDAALADAKTQAEKEAEAANERPVTTEEKDNLIRAEHEARQKADADAAAEAEAEAKAKAEAERLEALPQASLTSRAQAEIEGESVPVGHRIKVDAALHDLPLWPVAIDAKGRVWRMEETEDGPVLQCAGRVVV